MIKKTITPLNLEKIEIISDLLRGEKKSKHYNGNVIIYISFSIKGYNLELIGDTVKFGCQSITLDVLKAAKKFMYNPHDNFIDGLIHISGRKSSNVYFPVIEESDNFYITSKGAYSKTDYSKGKLIDENVFKLDNTHGFYKDYDLGILNIELSEKIDYCIELIETYLTISQK